MIEKADILHLGTLARIRLEEKEIEPLQHQINDILEYVSVIQDIAGDADELKQLGAVHNVFRTDEVTNAPGQYTTDLLNEMPAREGQFMKVKKILNND